MLFLWDVKHKTIKRKHFDASVTLCEFNAKSGGLGVEWNYSNRPSFHRYGKSAWLSIQILWLQVYLSADWGKKLEYKAALDRAHLRLV